ncbi:class I SAM-dependent methyltransferase [Streptomyces alboflavus]|uniref:class I SAM-dependent methyltransferase n=1 Tax=Streptomyces alboflavus TaxID=67267 RepID=UPI0036912BD9
MVNSYTELSSHYDQIMTSGYYDYGAYARTLRALLPDRPRLLELGTGTGLVVERILELADADPEGPPAPDITGIDHTESMLAQARTRVGERARFVQQDILHMDLPSAFDAAFSVGGIWYHTPDPGDADEGAFLLCSHLLDDEDNIKALRNVHASLKPGGVLVLAEQAAHRDHERDLPGGLVYAQTIQRADGPAGEDRFDKDYYVRRPDGHVVAHQRSTYRAYAREQGIALLKECGFQAECVSDDGLFRLYARL